MQSWDMTLKKLKEAVGKKVEIFAFGMVYSGVLKKVDLNEGTVQVEDKGDYVVLEIERIESMRVIR